MRPSTDSLNSLRAAGIKRGDRGFTLIELIVVLAILGLVLSLTLLRGAPGSPALQFDSTVRRVADTLRLARSRAIAEDRAIAVVMVPGGYRLDGDAAIPLPPGLMASGNDRIGFTPDGASSGGRVILRMGDRLMTIDVDWLTGRVSLARP